MQHIVYNAGYKLRYEHRGNPSGVTYMFRKKFATEIRDIDEEYFLGLTSRDIPWCPSTPKSEKPFKKLREFCEEKNMKEDRFLIDYSWPPRDI